MKCRGRTCAALAAAWTAGAAVAVPMRGPRLAEERPILPRGGVLMAALAAETEGDAWPAELALDLEDGRVVRGTVAWVHPDPASGGPDPPGWTDDPRGLAVRRIAPADDTSLPATGSAYLLAALPADAGSTFRVGGLPVRPRWLAAAPPRPEATGAAASGPGEPDAESPFERWRYAVLARVPGNASAPPALPGDEAAQLVAAHYSGLWTAGLDRLESLNAFVYRDTIDLLTRRAQAGTMSIAAWSARLDDVRRLLEVLADPQRSDRDVVVDARRWCDEQPLLAFRLPVNEESGVMVGVVNGADRPVAARFTWLGRLDAAEEVEIDSRSLRRVRVPRAPAPQASQPGAPGAAVSVLVVAAGSRAAQLTFPDRATPVRPPGLTFALRPAMILAEAQSGRQRGAAPERSTQVQVRRLAGRWEVFVDCRRPGGPARGGEVAPRLESMRGVEAITLLFGGDPAEVRLAIPESGSWRIWPGSEDAAVEVHRGSYGEAWFCRVVLPDSWLMGAGGHLLLGAVRSHGDGRALETGPYASLPWDPDPGRAVIDTGAW
jgi:hypothetical protein